MTPTDNLEAGAGDLVERIVPPQTQRDLADVQRFIGNARCELNVPTFQARYGWRLIDAVAEQAAQLSAVTAENARLRERIEQAYKAGFDFAMLTEAPK